jgi:hypothetical protein
VFCSIQLNWLQGCTVAGLSEWVCVMEHDVGLQTMQQAPALSYRCEHTTLSHLAALAV